MAQSVDLAHRARGAENAHRRRRSRGQSLVEFSIVLPVMLAIVGVVIDASRAYGSWTSLESATRDAAQYLARSDADPLSPDYTWAGIDADTKAIYVLDQATGLSFSRSTTQGALPDCSQPSLTTTYTKSTALAGGGSVSNPLSTATVKTCMPFHTLFEYPFLTSQGTWILRSEREFTMIVGR